MDERVGHLGHSATETSVDTKAFKGKGGERSSTYQHLQTLKEVQDEMQRLVLTTLVIPGCPIRLTVHRRSQTGQMTVRWRRGAGGGHIGWDELDEVIRRFPGHMRVWYQQASVLARELNSRELELRGARR